MYFLIIFNQLRIIFQVKGLAKSLKFYVTVSGWIFHGLAG
jgi:hypothetical protein